MTHGTRYNSSEKIIKFTEINYNTVIKYLNKNPNKE